METIDSQAIIDEHAAITDRTARVRQVNITLSAVEELRITLVRMRREDLSALVYQDAPPSEPLPRGRISEVARDVNMGRGRVREIIGVALPREEEAGAESESDPG